VLGLGLLALSIGMIAEAFRSSGWYEVSQHVRQNQPAAAIAAFFDAFHDAPLSIAAILFITATIVLVWPAARRTTTTAAASPSAAPPTSAPAAPPTPIQGAVQ
jgi:hypothetical protein